MSEKAPTNPAIDPYEQQTLDLPSTPFALGPDGNPAPTEVDAPIVDENQLSLGIDAVSTPHQPRLAESDHAEHADVWDGTTAVAPSPEQPATRHLGRLHRLARVAGSAVVRGGLTVGSRTLMGNIKQEQEQRINGRDEAKAAKVSRKEAAKQAETIAHNQPVLDFEAKLRGSESQDATDTTPAPNENQLSLTLKTETEIAQEKADKEMDKRVDERIRKDKDLMSSVYAMQYTNPDFMMKTDREIVRRVIQHEDAKKLATEEAASAAREKLAGEKLTAQTIALGAELERRYAGKVDNYDTLTSAKKLRALLKIANAEYKKHQDRKVLHHELGARFSEKTIKKPGAKNTTEKATDTSAEFGSIYAYLMGMWQEQDEEAGRARGDKPKRDQQDGNGRGDDNKKRPRTGARS